MIKELKDNIIVIAPIFVPNDIGLEIQLKSIKSFFNYLEHYKYRNVKIIFGGWCKDTQYWHLIHSLCTLQPHDIKIEMYDRNYGKAHVVNDLVSRFSATYRYMFTYDSDICFDKDVPRLFERLYKIAESLPDFGLLSLDQKEHNCQLYNHYTETKELFGEILKWHPGGAGIAGGCLFISLAAYKAVQGYRKMGVYDSDDGFLMLDLAATKRFLATVQTISIIHPYSPELKNGYNQWKADILYKRRLLGGGKYEDKFIDAERFWNE